MIFLSLGTNLGQKAENLDKALSLLTQKGVKWLRKSAHYATPPWGKTDQDNFLNMVVEVEFAGSPHELLARCLEVETQMGRVRSEKWGPRLIDIDIIDFHRQQISEPQLQLPHPFYPQRDFVMLPLRELEPDWEV